MRIEQDRLGQIKNYIYITSAALLFLTWCLSLAALTQGGGVDGRLAWTFGLCFLTIPMVIYQSLTPIWSRTARFSHPYAHCVVDGLLCIFWFSAWASLASYVISGKGRGGDSTKSGCDNFAHGSASKCRISEADIVFSVLMMCCFIVTSYFNFKLLMEYRRTGLAPRTGQIQKNNISYPQSVGDGYKEDEEAFDSRLDVAHDERDTGYSFEAARVHGGGISNTSYGQYETVPGGDDGYRRPLSFGGPLGSNRI
ncbi:hypothetical protein LTS08_008541 [Lithohypha guttulata]|uniref:MARVEL domain-containing protein n=1 Tax=Lithohypha guttulata TaxID=1690604 RepID=A0AAN7YEI5_9EURO|nr:hypothetical protein LTR51_003004 [Lithohypha guttulata]KAK5083185.1 hypothetical protein LTR05_007069 [Lithohypha guttulata]KAK5094490.1 hypothetical protein LTS08_008541 [Lithohypha guttulata]